MNATRHTCSSLLTYKSYTIHVYLQCCLFCIRQYIRQRPLAPVNPNAVSKLKGCKLMQEARSVRYKQKCSIHILTNALLYTLDSMDPRMKRPAILETTPHYCTGMQTRSDGAVNQHSVEKHDCSQLCQKAAYESNQVQFLSC